MHPTTRRTNPLLDNELWQECHESCRSSYQGSPQRGSQKHREGTGGSPNLQYLEDKSSQSELLDSLQHSLQHHVKVGVRKYGKNEKGSKRLSMQRRKRRIASDVGTVPISLHTLGNGDKGTIICEKISLISHGNKGTHNL